MTCLPDAKAKINGSYSLSVLCKDEANLASIRKWVTDDHLQELLREGSPHIREAAAKISASLLELPATSGKK